MSDGYPRKKEGTTNISFFMEEKWKLTNSPGQQFLGWFEKNENINGKDTSVT